MFRATWKCLGSINLAIWLLVLAAVNLAVGSLYARFYPKIVSGLDTMRFQDWLSPAVLPAGWWTLTLFVLLFFLGVNTVACTVDRVIFLVKRRRKNCSGTFLLELSPSLMHVCFIAAILGHALSQFTFSEIKLPVQPGSTIHLSAGSLTVDSKACTYREETLLKGSVKGCSAIMVLRTSEESLRREISILHPVFWKGYAIHLKMTGNPKPGESPGLNLLIKKDPGLMPMLWGGAVFCMVMVWYFLKIFKFRRGGL